MVWHTRDPRCGRSAPPELGDRCIARYAHGRVVVLPSQRTGCVSRQVNFETWGPGPVSDGTCHRPRYTSTTSSQRLHLPT